MLIHIGCKPPTMRQLAEPINNQNIVVQQQYQPVPQYQQQQPYYQQQQPYGQQQQYGEQPTYG